MNRPELKLTLDQAQTAFGGKFNCGPGAFCAVTGMDAEEAEPIFAKVGFMGKGYTNPTMMRDAIKLAHMLTREIYKCPADQSEPVNTEPHGPLWPAFGLVRIQWDGAWCRKGVPVAARYRKTHWIAVDSLLTPPATPAVFDINQIENGGWMPIRYWVEATCPWLIEATQPKSATGLWWPTHCWEVRQ